MVGDPSLTASLLGMMAAAVVLAGGVAGGAVGLAALATAACTADALHRGADHVVLFTDLANPTSNAIYPQIGYRPVSDRRVVRFER